MYGEMPMYLWRLNSNRRRKACMGEHKGIPKWKEFLVSHGGMKYE